MYYKNTFKTATEIIEQASKLECLLQDKGLYPSASNLAVYRRLWLPAFSPFPTNCFQRLLMRHNGYATRAIAP